MTTTQAMDQVDASSDLRSERLAGLGGIAFGVILLLWLFQMLNTVPSDDGSTQEWLAFMTEDPGVWVAYAILIGIGMMAFLWCLASLRSILARAEGGSGRLSTLVFGAGILTVGLLAVSLALIGAAPIAAEFLAAFEADPQMGLLLIGAAGIVFPFAAMAGGVVAAAASVLMLRNDTFPRWFAWASLVAGVAIFAAAVVDFTFLLLPVWTIVAGVLILTRSATEAGPPK